MRDVKEYVRGVPALRGGADAGCYSGSITGGLPRCVVLQSANVGPPSLLAWLLGQAGTLTAQVNVLLSQGRDHLHASQTAYVTYGADCDPAAPAD
jgi:hypothetical protein